MSLASAPSLVDGRAARRRDRLRMLRREILEIRTITMSLRSALSDLATDESLTIRQRIDLRRAWCTRSLAMLAQVESRCRSAGALLVADADRQSVDAVNDLISTARRDVDRLRRRAVA